MVDREFAEHDRLRFPMPAQCRPDPGYQLDRRERLDDVVGGARVERLGDSLVAAVAGDEDDRQVGELGDPCIRSMMSLPGSIRSSSTSRRFAAYVRSNESHALLPDAETTIYSHRK